MARKTLAQGQSVPVDEQRIADRIKRRLARQPRGRTMVDDFDGLVQRLHDLPSPPADLSTILAFLSQLAMTVREEPRGLSPIPGSASSSRTVKAPIEESHEGGSRPNSALPRISSFGSGPQGGVRPLSRAAYDLEGDQRPKSSLAPSVASSAEDGSGRRRVASDVRRRADLGSRMAGAADEAKAMEDEGEEPGVAQQTAAEEEEELPRMKPVDETTLGHGVLPKATVLQKWREAAECPVVPERTLLRDVIYLLQGINGHHVRFEEVRQTPIHDPGVISSNRKGEDLEPMIKVTFVEDGVGSIPAPTRHLLHRLAEPGKHCKRITSFVRAQAMKEEAGRIMQSFCRFLDEELENYYRLIVRIEAKYNEGPVQASNDEDPALSEGVDLFDPELKAVLNKGLTLKQVTLLVGPSLLRLRLMSSLVEGAQHTHGGALVSLVHSYTFHGDPLVRSFTEHLLEEISRSFFASLGKWIYDGDLSDPFGEFFVELDPDMMGSINATSTAAATAATMVTGAASPTEDVDAAALWEHKFRFKPELVPAFVAEKFARQIYSAGKSLNFIRYSCGDEDWKEARAAILATVSSPSSTTPPTLRYRDLAGLEKTISVVHATISKRLLDIFLDKFRLQAHLRAINDYMLLTRGDFSEVLMESLAPLLHKQASLLYRHSLSGALETAIRSSNAQYDDEEILRRLDARVLEFSGQETGWETFTLEYRVDSPVNTVLDANAMAEYQQVFQHLWKMKRIEGSLTSACARMMRASGQLIRASAAGVKGRKRRQMEKDEDVEALRHEAQRSLVLLSHMTHFVRQLQGYNQLEVISYSWSDLESFFEKRSGDLDVLIAAHRSYLSSLHGKVLLRGGGGGSGKEKGSRDYLAGELRSNFDSILRFTSGAEQLSTFITDFLEKRSLGAGLDDEEADEEATTRRLSSILRALSDSSSDFKERTEGIIARLERHSNLVIRDLSVRLDYNGFYARSRPERTMSAMDRRITSGGVPASDGAVDAHAAATVAAK